MDDSGHQITTTLDQSDEKQHAAPSSKKPVLSAGIAAIRRYVDKVRRLIDWYKYLKFSLYYATILLLVGGFLYWKFYLNGMVVKTVSAGGYSYSFTFYRAATFVQNSNGMRGYRIDDGHSAMVGPVSGLPQLCGLKGSPYALAFTVHLYGADRLVCTTQDSHDDQIYMVNFATQGGYHEFVVTYGYTRNINDYPKLKTIFESITVSP